MRFASRTLLVALLVFGSMVTLHAEDPIDGEVRDEGEEQEQQLETEATEETITSSPDAQTSFIFVQPEAAKNLELVAGQVTKFLIGFANRGEKDFVVDVSQSSFRYPVDYNYHVLNFTTANYGRTVAPKQEATFDYAFVPNEAFIGRPLILAVELHYHDVAGNPFTATVYNQTITVIEDDNANVGEYALLILTGLGLTVLFLLIGQNVLSRFTRSKAPRSRPLQETGTNSDVDYEWIPALNTKKSPNPNSPRRRPKTQKDN